MNGRLSDPEWLTSIAPVDSGHRNLRLDGGGGSPYLVLHGGNLDFERMQHGT
jgi:hypothetical protein